MVEKNEEKGKERKERKERKDPTPWTWPETIAKIAFWAAVVLIVWIICGHGKPLWMS